MTIASYDRRVVGFRSVLIAQGQVIYALLMRDVRSRFFGNGFGHLLAIAWPLTHLLVILAMFSAGGRVPPVGDSMLLFLSTGVAPFILFNYTKSLKG
jgi:capsular polysaccharide transport system permease protein